MLHNVTSVKLITACYYMWIGQNLELYVTFTLVRFKVAFCDGFGQNMNLGKPTQYDGRSLFKSGQHFRFSKMFTCFEYLPFDIVTITRSVKKSIPSCQNCQPENTHNACKQIITFRFAVKTHLKINAQKRNLHQNGAFETVSFIITNISSFRRFVWPQFALFHRMISPTK